MNPIAAPPAASPAPAPAPAAPAAAPSGSKGFKPSQFSDNARGLTPPAPERPAPAAPERAETIRGFAPQLGSDEVDDAGASDDAAITALAGDDGGDVDAGGDVGDQDPWAEQIHGMSAKDLIEALKNGDTLPESLLDALQHEFDFGDGNPQRMTLREALAESQQERMQLRDYHRELHKVRQREQEVATHAEALQTSITALDNPDTLIDDLSALGVSDKTLDAAMRAYARRMVEYQQLPEGVRKALDETRAAKVELAKQRQQLEQFKQREAQQTQAQANAAYKTAIQQHAPAAFMRNGINPKDAYVRDRFGYFLEQATGGKTPTKEHINAAAKATRQDIAFLQKRDQPAAPGKRDPKGRPLGPNRAAAPTALSVPKQAPKTKGLTPSQFETFARGR